VYSPASSNLTVSLTPLPDRWAMAWWVDAGTDHAYLASMGADGSLLDAPLAVASSLVGQRNPAVAFSGTEVAVAWQDYGTDPNGIVLDRARPCD
jgi:hypothetical protein